MKPVRYGEYLVFENGDVINKHGKKLSFTSNGRGYQITCLYLNGRRITKAKHRILAECFISKTDPLHDEVNHIDGDKSNNSLANLEWCTRSDNLKHAYAMKLRDCTGEKNSRCKTTVETVTEICKLLEAGYTPAQVRDKGYSYSLVRKIKDRSNWYSISKDFNF